MQGRAKRRVDDKHFILALRACTPKQSIHIVLILVGVRLRPVLQLNPEKAVPEKRIDHLPLLVGRVSVGAYAPNDLVTSKGQRAADKIFDCLRSLPQRVAHLVYQFAQKIGGVPADGGPDVIFRHVRVPTIQKPAREKRGVWFGLLTSHALRHRSFNGVCALADAIYRFAHHWVSPSRRLDLQRSRPLRVVGPQSRDSGTRDS